MKILSTTWPIYNRDFQGSGFIILVCHLENYIQYKSQIRSIILMTISRNFAFFQKQFSREIRHIINVRNPITAVFTSCIFIEDFMSPKILLISVLVLFVLTGCNAASTTSVNTSITTITPTLEFPEATLVPAPIYPTQPIVEYTVTPASLQQEVLDRASEVIMLIKNKDMVTLSNYVHPLLGLRFSPYAFVKDSDQVFSANQVAGLLTNNTLYTWGSYDGSGAPIELTFVEYYFQFVFDVDFSTAPQVALNHRLGEGNSLDNSQEFYPGSMVVEYYFPGFDPQYEGMDWRSLRLIFLQDNDIWYLAGIVHDQWTT
jgi:hypothetical protein